MAWTQTELASVESAIVKLASGQRTVQVSIGGKSLRYGEADLPQLRSLRNEIRSELNAAAGKGRPILTTTRKGL